MGKVDHNGFGFDEFVFHCNFTKKQSRIIFKNGMTNTQPKKLRQGLHNNDAGNKQLT